MWLHLLLDTQQHSPSHYLLQLTGVGLWRGPLPIVAMHRSEPVKCCSVPDILNGMEMACAQGNTAIRCHITVVASSGDGPTARAHLSFQVRSWFIVLQMVRSIFGPHYSWKWKSSSWTHLRKRLFVSQSWENEPLSWTLYIEVKAISWS